MLILYFKPTCPYCARVFEAASELGVEFTRKDIKADPTLRDELIELGGKKQVPYLVDEERGEAMYESEDIIEYLKEHYGHNSAPQKTVKVFKSDQICQPSD